MNKILAFIQLPPPVHGVTLMNKYVLSIVKNNHDINLRQIELGYSSKINDLGNKSIGKVFKFISYILKLLKELIVFKPRFIYLSPMIWGAGFYRDIVFIFLIKIFNVTPIYHLHGKGVAVNINRNRLNHFLYHFCFSNSHVIHLSANLLKKEIEIFNFKNCKTWVLPNGIKDENQSNNILQNNTGALKIIFLSNLQVSKGIFDFLELASLCISNNLNTNFEVIGAYRNSENKKEIENYIENKKLKNEILFHGPKYGKDKYELLKTADILVHPTYNDAFPLVILEAKMFGLVVISTTQGAIPEMIENGNDGFIVDEGDVKEMYNKIKLLAGNMVLLNNMKLESRKSFINKFSLKSFEKNLQKAITSIL